MSRRPEVRLEPRPVRGFRFAGVAAGLKTDLAKKDLGLIVADTPASAAGVFTTSKLRAAPSLIAQECVRRGRVQAVAANSGSANCFTGKAGLKLARDSCHAVAREFGCGNGLVAPCSTGVIGHLYDFKKYCVGIGDAVRSLSADGLTDFATAIMTTDTRPKMASTAIRIGSTEVTIAGCAKGAGMIAPNMATLLAFLVTDAVATPPVLRKVLQRVVRRSFNAITIDGDMSTNDTVLILASGAARNRAMGGRDLLRFQEAVEAVSAMLARELVRDGEGATKLVTIEVRGARSQADADQVARQIANSPLVKTAFFGCDPNVGRLLMAAGKSGAALDPDRLVLAVGGVKVAARGAVVVDALERARDAMREREFTVTLDLRIGNAISRMTTCDLTYDYVRINAEYTT